MKTLTFALFFTLTCCLGFSQNTKPDSLKQALKMAKNDSTRYNLCVKLNIYYSELNLDSALFYTEERLAIAKRNNYKLAEAQALTSKGYQDAARGRYAASYQNLLLAFKIAKDPKTEEIAGWQIAQHPIPGKGRLQVLANAHQNFSALMRNTENINQEIVHLKEALSIVNQLNFIDRKVFINMNLAQAFLNLNQLDSALYFAKVADIISKNPAYAGPYRGLNISKIGDVFLKKGDTQLAKKYYYEGLLLSNQKNNKSGITQINHKLIQMFLNENEKDSALIYSVKNLGIIKTISNESVETIAESAYKDVYLAYRLNNQIDSAYKYQGLALVAKDSMYKIRVKNIADFQSLLIKEAMRLENLEKEAILTQSKIRTYTLLSALAVLSIIGFSLYRNNRQKQKANIILETTLKELKATQAQLIQSEKLASLGELTAGIAHEIQNPLNFVNNFSEVSGELVAEMEEEMKGGNTDIALEIGSDLKQNLEKINHHGKRASSIVKGMLEHSRTSTGVKELTDINALADEYLRFAYHGLRAKNSSFNSDFKTDFDEKLPKIKVIPQDIGRVLLNLINNAFYACTERSRSTVKSADKPLVVVSTKKVDNQVIISVKDNGSGMTDEVKSKIFQPFFTTKPTGQGTGLGLSLAYDIVTKGHGGTIECESVEGKGTEFIIQLPYQAQ